MPAVPSSTFHLVGNIITVLTPPFGGKGQMMVAHCRTKPGAGAMLRFLPPTPQVHEPMRSRARRRG